MIQVQGFTPLHLEFPKQSLPIYNKPMACLLCIRNPNSIWNNRDTFVITAKQDHDIFYRTLGDGQRFGAKLSYTYQEAPDGIAKAIMLGQNFIADEAVCLITGDTVIVGESLHIQLIKAYKTAEKSGNATPLCK